MLQQKMKSQFLFTLSNFSFAITADKMYLRTVNWKRKAHVTVI